MSEATARAQPFCCPYCGEPEIRPTDEHAVWYCATCDRRWRLSYLGRGQAPGEPTT
jgi:ribosomal protein L37AE/L43A